MLRLPWMPGPETKSSAVFLSATRFTYRKQRYMLSVFWHGLRLRGQWSTVDGAIGVFEGASILERTTYTLTAWRSAEDMGRWLRTPYHARLMRDFSGCLESSAAVSWLTDSFEPRAAWVDGMKRLEAGPPP